MYPKLVNNFVKTKKGNSAGINIFAHTSIAFNDTEIYFWGDKIILIKTKQTARVKNKFFFINSYLTK